MRGTSPTIDEPRGLPEDACHEFQEYVEQWGQDGHSHSYLYLTEILEFDWTEGVHQHSIIKTVDYLSWRMWGKKQGHAPPDPQYFHPGNKTVLSMQDVDDIISLAKTNGEEHNSLREKFAKGDELVDVEWTEFLTRACRSFWLDDIPTLLKYAKEYGGTDNVRICFFFDS